MDRNKFNCDDAGNWLQRMRLRSQRAQAAAACALQNPAAIHPHLRSDGKSVPGQSRQMRNGRDRMGPSSLAQPLHEVETPTDKERLQAACGWLSDAFDFMRFPERCGA